MVQGKVVGLMFFLVIFSQSFILMAYGLPQIEIDLTGVANYVVDGDTFDVVVANGTQYRIRLADVNASEKGQVGYTQAKDYLSSLVYSKTVYLDVDDVYVYDYSGTGNRLVCVPYVEYNSTHLLNVNEALIQAGHIEIKDYNNEFDPHAWTLYVSKEAIPEFPSLLTLLVFMIAILLIFVFYKNYHIRKPSNI